MIPNGEFNTKMPPRAVGVERMGTVALGLDREEVSDAVTGGRVPEVLSQDDVRVMLDELPHRKRERQRRAAGSQLLAEVVSVAVARGVSTREAFDIVVESRRNAAQ
jgi:hypothetical protein